MSVATSGTCDAVSIPALQECRYHVVFIPKCRRRRCMGISGAIWGPEGEPDRRGAPDAGSCAQMIAIPPKYAVSQVIGYIKGKSAIHLARVYGEPKRNFVGQHFWAGGYFVSTVGRDEAVIREYIRHQEREDQRLEQMN